MGRKLRVKWRFVLKRKTNTSGLAISYSKCKSWWVCFSQFVLKWKKYSSELAICLQNLLTKVDKLRILMSIFPCNLFSNNKTDSLELAISCQFLYKIHKLRVLMSVFLAVCLQMKWKYSHELAMCLQNLLTKVDKLRILMSISPCNLSIKGKKILQDSQLPTKSFHKKVDKLRRQMSCFFFHIELATLQDSQLPTKSFYKKVDKLRRQICLLYTNCESWWASFSRNLSANEEKLLIRTRYFFLTKFVYKIRQITSPNELFFFPHWAANLFLLVGVLLMCACVCVCVCVCTCV